LNKNYDDTIKKTQAQKVPNQNHWNEKLHRVQAWTSCDHENAKRHLSDPAGCEQTDPKKSKN